MVVSYRHHADGSTSGDVLDAVSAAFALHVEADAPTSRVAEAVAGAGRAGHYPRSRVRREVRELQGELRDADRESFTGRSITVENREGFTMSLWRATPVIPCLLRTALTCASDPGPVTIVQTARDVTGFR